jgi:hypothetical protein
VHAILLIALDMSANAAASSLALLSIVVQVNRAQPWYSTIYFPFYNELLSLTNFSPYLAAYGLSAFNIAAEGVTRK